MKQRTQAGYILVVTLMIISVVTFLVVYVAGKATVFSAATRSEVDRQQAQLLATSGVQLAIGQLVTIDAPSQQEQQKEQAQKGAQDDKKIERMVKKIVPLLGRWQQFTLQKERDGVRGSISLCLMSEDGKINLNQFYDTTAKKFYLEGKEGDRKKLLQDIVRALAPLVGADAEKMLSDLQAFLKKQTHPINEVTQLLTLSSFAPFNEQIFYDPPEQNRDEKPGKRSVYLTDIFTVYSDKATVQPWLLSDSVRILFGLQPTQFKAPSVEQIKNVTQKAAWDRDWDTYLAPIYGKKFSDVPKYSKLLLDGTFAASRFSVLSYAKVGKITQRLLAILERSKVTDQDGSEKVTVIIKKLYWL